MDRAEYKVESQVQFWSIIGPFFLLVSIAILLFKLSSHWVFPVSALLGIPLCLKWHMKGMAASLSLLFLFSIIGYQSLNVDERYWHVGMGLAMAFSFIVLTLSLEEVESLVGNLERESKSRLDNYLILGESMAKAEELWKGEKKQLLNQIEGMTQTLERVQEDKHNFYRLAQLAKDEVVMIREQHHLLKEELVYKKLQLAQVNEKLEESELMVQAFVNTDAEQKISLLERQIDQFIVEREDWQSQQDLNKKELQDKVEQLTELEEKIAQLEDGERETSLRMSHLLSEKMHLSDSLNSLKEQELALIKEKDQLQETFTALRQQYEKVVQSEGQSRQNLHLLNGRIAQSESDKVRLEEQLESMKESYQKLEQQSLILETDLRNESGRLQGAMKQVRQEIDRLDGMRRESEEQLVKVSNELLEWQRRCQSLEMEIQNKIQMIAKLESEKEEMRLQNAESQPQAIEVDPMTRKYEGLYKQLRDQFQEKSTVLDKTRQELFLVKEEVMRIEKDHDEEKMYGVSECEAAWMREFEKLNEELDRVEKGAQEEIQSLEQLVGDLLKMGLQTV